MLRCQCLSFLLLVAGMLALTSATASRSVAARTILKPLLRNIANDGILGVDASLADTEVWHYGGDGTSAKVSITGNFADSHQKVICMDRFAALIKSTACSDNRDSISYTFTDTTAFQSAKQEWNWVNAKDAHNFILTLHKADCHANTDDDRHIYQVTGISWDDAKLVATLAVTPKTWDDVLGTGAPRNTWEVFIDSKGQAASSSRKRFDIDKDGAIDLTHDFSGQIFEETDGNVTVRLDCAQCHTDGSLDFQIHIVPYLIPPKLEGFAELTPNNIGATAVIAFNSTGPLSKPLRKPREIATLRLPGGFVAGPVTVGPTLHIGIVAGFESISVGTSASFGVKMTVPETSIAKIDLSDSDNNQFSGWAPDFTPVQPVIQNPFNTSMVVTPQILVALEATVFGQGISAGLSLFAPELAIDAQILAGKNSTGCNSTSTSTGEGFCLDFGVGAELDAFAGFGSPIDLPNSLKLFSTKASVFSTCIPLDGPVKTTTSSKDPKPTKPTKNSTHSVIGTGTGTGTLPKKTTCVTLKGKAKETGGSKKSLGPKPVDQPITIVECVVFVDGQAPVFANTTISYERPGRVTMRSRMTTNTVL